MEFWLKVVTAIVLGIIIIRLWPAASHMLKHGPKGSSSDWQAALLPIVAVIGFVVLLIMMVRG